MSKSLQTMLDWNSAPVRLEKIDELVFDWKLYPRKSIDYSIVYRYAKALKAGAVFPPIKVGLLNGTKIIVDGVHRVKAHQNLGIDHIRSVSLPFKSEAELFAEAVKCNSSHGRPFGYEDIRKSIQLLKKYRFDVNEIVSLIHVPASEITRINTKPITKIQAPCGRRIYCTGKPDFKELIQFKRALMLIRDVARVGCIPDEEPFRTLVRECREALGRLRFNGY